jgi:hypothetical protein
MDIKGQDKHFKRLVGRGCIAENNENDDKQVKN